MIVDQTRYEDSLPALVSCFERCFGQTVNAALLRWRYLHNPFGELLANVVYGDDGAVLANYSACPQPLVSPDGSPIRAALSMTTMVDPSMRGQGMFVKLCTELQDHMANQGFRMIYGFPNAASYGGFIRRLGWEHWHAFPRLSSRVRSHLSHGSALSDDNFELDYALLDGVLQGRYHVKRDQQWLQWRYGSHPTQDYSALAIADSGRVSALTVFKTWKESLDVVELIAPDKDSVLTLLGELHQVARERELESLSCWMPEHHDHHQTLIQQGFVPVEPVTRFAGRPVSSGHDKIDWQNWFIQMGDSDVF